MTQQIISLSGFKGHGKDTVGHMLSQHAGYTCVSFAQPLKHMLSIQFGWDLTQLEGITPESRAWREQPDPYWSEKLGRPFTPRQAMTEIGTDLIRRKFLDSQWCDLMEKHVQHVTTPVVITDARFPNELAMIKRMGGINVWIKRDPMPDWYTQAEFLNRQPQFMRKWLRPFMPALRPVHESESAWVGWQFDHVIENHSSLQDLELQVVNWYKQLT